MICNTQQIIFRNTLIASIITTSFIIKSIILNSIIILFCILKKDLLVFNYLNYNMHVQLNNGNTVKIISNIYILVFVKIYALILLIYYLTISLDECFRVSFNLKLKI